MIVKDLDLYAIKTKTTRSDVIRQALMLLLKDEINKARAKVETIPLR
ncbi:ribbon-helix-helix protein, CopG family [Sulfolobus sp. E11-6]|nr:ribbon-helix-helix protein, CopG family [Sulfolobus sp. E11-6]